MSDFRILITGSRLWTDRDTIAKAIRDEVANGRGHDPEATEPRRMVVVHGGAKGADTIAGEIATAWGMQVEVHRADWNTHGAGAGPKRNQLMVDLGADVVLAFPIGESKGTRDCVRRAEKAGLPVVTTEGET